MFCFLVLTVGEQMASGQSHLKTLIENLKNDSDLTNASWSICVMDVKKDSVLAEYNSHISLIPASVNKIITTATALAILKWDFRYETILEYDGTLDKTTGILHGNIYIKGSGDPTLESEVFKKKSDTIPITDQWANILSKTGIKKIEGGIVADATAFEDEMVPSGWLWGDLGNYYGAGSCGLNFKDNKFTLYFQSGAKNGDSATITKISPEIPNMKVLNYVRTRGYSDNAYVYGSPYTLVRYVKGTIPINKTNYKVEGSMPDPALFCAQSLDSSLRKIGISIGKKASVLRKMLPSAEEFISTDIPSPEWEETAEQSETSLTSSFSMAQTGEKTTLRFPLHKHTSHTLDKIVYQTNLQSNNLYAETLLKTIAWKKKQWGDDQTAIDIVTNYWKEKKIDLKGFYMADGSGLSRLNAITTKQLSQILVEITKDSVLFSNFYASLPVAGKSGTLGKLCKGTLAENNLRAKSGYMTRVRSYAGYCTSKKGNLMSFAIIVNNYTCNPYRMKDKLEKLMIAIAEIE
jgi:D-alanyl-D-alanine carboxypeptidase/D-alanyl-D-alanine-endopeptidase (penicillin-binding protein 4)